MSIRKPSETTSHPDRSEIDPGRWSRVLQMSVIVLLSMSLLGACAEGTASDAERGKAQDALRTSVVTDLQATESAKLLQPSSPEATATAAPTAD